MRQSHGIKADVFDLPAFLRRSSTATVNTGEHDADVLTLGSSVHNVPLGEAYAAQSASACSASFVMKPGWGTTMGETT